jgi:3-oxoacyl-[acyl-carrier-protein] synthase-3
VATEMMQKHQITAENLSWLVPHQANMRIIEAVARRMELNPSQVMVNIRNYGNTTAATVPLCLYDYEKQLKKGDNLILAAFGAGFTWGALYLKWAYDSESETGNRKPGTEDRKPHNPVTTQPSIP